MANSANKLMKEMQKIASDATIQVQRLANEATEKSFKYNAEEASTARAWQKEMSDTAHQREVADLKKAGLNPVLATNNGAQSYTTSSASAQANDPSSSIGNLAGTLIQGRSNAYSADKSAAATRAAAATSAAAMKAAAAQQAAAQRYAAAMSYQASVYHSDKAFEAQKYKAKMDYKIAMQKPQNNPFAIADKYFSKYNIDSKVLKNVTSYAKNVNSTWFKNDAGSKVNSNNFILSKHGERAANKILNNLKVTNNNFNRHLAVRAFVFGNDTAMRVLANRSGFTLRRYNNAATNVANRFNRRSIVI